MIKDRQQYEICLQYEIDGDVVNGVLHSFMDNSFSKVVFLVPGLYGDRCDSRAMFVKIARKLASLGYNVVRFDYVGGGINLGDYSTNDFAKMIDTLSKFIGAVTKQFIWFKSIGLIGFSEGGKICVRASKILDFDLEFVGLCNALLVEEDLLLEINRPKLINGNLVYDSGFGVWTSLSIVEDYKNWYVDKSDLTDETVYAAVYSDEDDLTKKSAEFLTKNQVLVEIVDGDHLFTSEKWCNGMIEKWLTVIEKYWPIDSFKKENEYFVNYGNESIMTKVIRGAKASKTILFVHGFAQNKMGASCLYSDIAKVMDECNYVYFDFVGSGESTGEIVNMSYSDYLDQLSFMIDYSFELFPDTELILIGSGTGNQLIVNCPKAHDLKKVYINPSDIDIWSRLSLKERMKDTIDTHEIYMNYDWAENEFKKAGNDYNRCKGLVVNTKYLFEISNVKFIDEIIANDKKAICITNKKRERTVEINDDSHLLLSAKKREKAISNLKVSILGQ